VTFGEDAGRYPRGRYVGIRSRGARRPSGRRDAIRTAEDFSTSSGVDWRRGSLSIKVSRIVGWKACGTVVRW